VPKYEYTATRFDTYDSGIGIIAVNYGIDDSVSFQRFYGERFSRKITARISYTQKGAYFMHFGRRYYLNEFLRRDLA
jgi:hypothetical protein